MDEYLNIYFEALSVKQIAQDAVRKQRKRIHEAEHAIYEICKVIIPEWHFLNHKLSDFWNCDKSPLGWCVWDISENGFNVDCKCYYCHGPVQRK